MDGYTFMIERNKLLIAQAREREQADPRTPLPADAESLLRKRLMELYAELDGCGRERRNSE